MTAPFFVRFAKVWCIFAGKRCHQSVALCPLAFREPRFRVGPWRVPAALAGARWSRV